MDKESLLEAPYNLNLYTGCPRIKWKYLRVIFYVKNQAIGEALIVYKSKTTFQN